MRRAVAAFAVSVMTVAGAPEAKADGIPRFPFEVYAGAGVTEWAHAELDLVFGSLGYLLGRAAIAGRGDPLLGGGLVLSLPIGSAWADAEVPAHALLLGLAGMYNPDSPGFANRRRAFMSPLLQDPLHGYGEATIGYGFHARSGLGIRIVGGGLFDEPGVPRADGPVLDRRQRRQGLRVS